MNAANCFREVQFYLCRGENGLFLLSGEFGFIVLNGENGLSGFSGSFIEVSIFASLAHPDIKMLIITNEKQYFMIILGFIQFYSTALINSFGLFAGTTISSDCLFSIVLNVFQLIDCLDFNEMGSELLMNDQSG